MTADLMIAPGLAAGIARCAGCGSEHSRWVTAGDQRNELCLACGACWHLSETGQLIRVSMRDCVGCGFQAVCLAAPA